MSLSGQPLMVLGAFRSGTSSLCAVLTKLGVYFGEERALYGANEHNPGGHYELMDLQIFDNNVFDSFGMKYYSGGALPENWSELPVSNVIVNTLRAILNKHFAGRKLYAWKDPSASGLVPIYKAALQAERIEARYPICVRHPHSVVASMRKRSGTPAKFSPGNAPEDHSHIDFRMMGVWLYYTLASLRDTNGDRRQIFCYENFISKPEEYVDRVIGLLDAPVSDAKRAEAIASIRPEWIHTKFSMADLAEWPDIIAKTYQLCLDADSDPFGFAEGRFDAKIEELWDEWRTTRLMFQSAMAPGELIRANWQNFGWSGQLNPSGWTTASIKVSAPAGTSIKINPYRSPCQMWIRKALWQTAAGPKRAALRATDTGMLEQVYGLPLLTVFNADPLIVEAPGGEATLELEVLVQADRDVLTNLVPVISDRVRQSSGP